MVIKKRHAELLLEVGKAMEAGEETYVYRKETAPKEDERTLRELEYAGLLRLERPIEYVPTYSGTLLIETLTEAINSKLLEHPSKWPNDFRWIGSEVIAMIDGAVRCQGQVRGEIAKALEERGFARNGMLTPLAETIIDIYKHSHPYVTVSKELAEYIKKMPPGPAETKILPVGNHNLLELEAQRLIAFSVPKSDVYALTGLGQKIRQAIRLGAPVESIVVSADILDSIYRVVHRPSEVPNEMRILLMELAYIGPDGKLLPAGRALYDAYLIYREGPITISPSVQLTTEEVHIIKVIDELWRRHETNPEIFPDRKRIRELLKEKWPYANYEVTSALYTLESFQLIYSEEFKGKLVYKLTDYGQRVLEDQNWRERPISAAAVSAITLTRREYSAPGIDWVQRGREEGLLGTGAPTKSGMLYADIAESVDKKPHITRIENRVLAKIPLTRGMFIEDILAQFPEREHDEVMMAIEKLDAREVLEILPVGAVVLTDAGRLIKRALAGVPDSFANPVNPLLVRFLEALREVGTLYEKERKIRVTSEQWKKAEKLTGLDAETLREEIILAQKAKFIGHNRINESGLMLLEALDLIKSKKRMTFEYMEG